jgi:hypothetical protein
MAIDTRLKRASAISIIVPFMVPGVEPDGTIEARDRQAQAWVYSGILAGAAVVAADGDYIVRARRRQRR